MPTGPAFAESAGADEAQQIECPVCGGKAQPGELICNFCGARLGIDPAAEQYTPPPARPSTAPRSPTLRRGPSPSRPITGRMPEGDDSEKEGRGMFGVLGYLIAAIVALGGGAWLAIHLSSKGAETPVANASPSAAASVAAAVPTGPLVALANAMPVQVTGESASAPERNQDAARKFFDDHKNPLLDSYEHALAGDNTLRNAMVVRVRVLPSGNVDAASVRTSTNPNPAFDAEVVKDVSTWNYPPFSGSDVEIDYPIVFTNDPSTKDALESQLNTKLTGLSPTEPPEFASSPPAPSSAASEAVSAPTPASVETPPTEAVAPAPLPPAPAPRKHHHVASAPKPPPMTLQQRVLQVLSSNPRTRRVNCYTSGNTVTIFGKVFDNDAKLYTEKLVRNVPGVGNVIDSLSTDQAEWAARQAAIASQLYAAGLNTVTVKVIGHDAYLDGTVKTDAQKQQAVTITENASPVHVAGNLIRVVPGNMFGF
ncbi:MAG: TonB family protein [Candidatus Binatus sp.]|uniref:TonB family protein n=1 Tax=Candidatus Binatus sp. TaxID=2811406 RepID=UPI003BB0768C